MFESVKRGMSRTRQRFTEQINVLLDRGPQVDEAFWDGLEEALILSDVGAQAACDIVERMRHEATRRALPDACAVMDALTEEIAQTFTESEYDLFESASQVVLFVGINGAGKTTTVGKIAAAAHEQGRKVLLGSADTFRAAAIEQLEVWADRAHVEIVERERGSDPASVCYDTLERAETLGSDLVLIDTAGRLHTSDDLMRELSKVVEVVRKRSSMPVATVLVIDATTGQNGLAQARVFDAALDLDAVIITKLDGTAKGGIALAISHELGLPIARVGVGEQLSDLQQFNAYEFAAALIGAEEVQDEPDEDLHHEEYDDTNIEEDHGTVLDDQSDMSEASEEFDTQDVSDEGAYPQEKDQMTSSDLEQNENLVEAQEPLPEQEPRSEGRFARLFSWRGRKKD